MRALVIALALLAAGCSGQQPGPAEPVRADRANQANPATDAAWVQLMAPLTDQARGLLRYAAGRSADRRLTAWAVRLAAAQAAALTRLHDTRRRLGLPDKNIHEGHEMPGMVTETDADRARELRGQALDRFVIQQIKEHLDQCVRLSEAAARNAADPAVRDLAADLAGGIGRELARLPAV
jgi:uncharacterized protein (DUF305 family)